MAMKKFNVTVNGTTYEVEVEEVKAAGGSAPKADDVFEAIDDDDDDI